MIVIDIAQRDASRSRPAPMISFRRTDADRRPARRFAQPNDGPAPDRLAQSEARRAALKRRSQQPPREPYLTRSEAYERSVSLTLAAIGEGKTILPEIAPLVGVGPERTRDFAHTLVARGLAFKQLERREKNRSYTCFYLTDAGKALLTGSEP